MARILRYIGLVLTVLTVAVGPYFQGLFFPLQQHVAESVLAVGFLVWCVSLHLEGRRLTLLADGVEIAALALLVCYLLASFTAVYPYGHLNVVLQVVAGLLVFYLLREEAKREPRLGIWLGWTVVVAGASVALVGLAPYVGLLERNPALQEALANWGSATRLASTFEYWNTYAVFAVSLWMVLTGLALGARRRAIVLPIAGVTAATPARWRSTPRGCGRSWGRARVGSRRSGAWAISLRPRRHEALSPAVRDPHGGGGRGAVRQQPGGGLPLL